MSAPNSSIIVDKSYLQGATKAEMVALSARYRLAVSDALFFELLTCGSIERAGCFSKFPPGDDPVDLINHIGTLINLEISGKKPCGKPSKYKEGGSFKFNPKVASIDFVLNTEQEKYLLEEKENIKRQVEAFLSRAVVTGTMFPNVIFGNPSSRDEVEKLITTHDALMHFYSTLIAEGDYELPPAELLSPEWAIYRWLQVEVLAAFNLYFRYNGAIPTNLEGKTYENIEHDLLDAQLLMLGCQEGVFATRDKKLIRWWSLICPTATLVS
jgi:hypothetical protein